MCLIAKKLRRVSRAEVRGKLACLVWSEVYSLHASVPSLYTNFINCELLKENDAVIIKLECGGLDFIP